jgi:N6-L-threonylcarbamoyladenine synthase
MIILGIETSCDECAAAVVSDGGTILSNVISSQIALHAPYGGVIPEVASRSHMRTIGPVIDEALRRAAVGLDAVDAVAVTQRPGLIGSLLVGLCAAKGLALARGLPIIPVNHVNAHIFACLAGREEPLYPAAALVVSGGHTSLYLVRSVLEHDLAGRTLDDAAGEAFDKVAAILGLEYPGGPSLERAARGAGEKRFDLPRPLPGGRESLDFSFSGLKTAVLYRCRGVPTRKKGSRGKDGRAAKEAPRIAMPLECDVADAGDVAAMAASFQEAVADVLTRRLVQAAERHGARSLAVGGGVAANALLRKRVADEAAARGLPLYLSPPELATDNAAMVAGLGYHIHRSGQRFDLGFDAYSGL